MNRIFSAILVGLVLTGSAFALADNYRPVRIEVGAIVPMELGEFSQGGFGFIFEPKLNITDQLSTGLRWHLGLMAGDGITAMNSYMLKADYFFNTNTVRPYATIGLGLNQLAGASLEVFGDGDAATAVAGNFFGVMPGVGINLGGFRLGVGVNLIFAKQHVWDSDAADWDEEGALRTQLIFDATGSILHRKR